MPFTRAELENLRARAELPSVAEIVALLSRQGESLPELYAAADAVRARSVGDEVHLRGIVEFSNYCRKHCNYCGIRAGTQGVERFRLEPAEIVELAFRARALGYGTIVLQSGEDAWYTCERLCELLRAIKADGPELGITLSIGERPAAEYLALHEAGCDRFLMRFETSDRELFLRLHPDDDFDYRLQCLRDIRAAGIQTGSGFMIGLPGMTLDGIAKDILFATELDLDMIGCGPFIPSPVTPLKGAHLLADREVYYKTIAILRLLNPYAHIPATTAFDAIFKDGRNNCLKRGANVFMPSITPVAHRRAYLLYPNKPCVDEDSSQCALCTSGRILGMGRKIAKGPGHSQRPGWRQRQAESAPPQA